MRHGVALCLLAGAWLAACTPSRPRPEAWPEVGGGALRPGARTLAVVPFAQSADAGASFARVVAADLARTGAFRVLAPHELPQQPVAAAGIEYESWRALGVDHVVVGRVREEAGAQFARFEVADVRDGRVLARHDVGPTDPRQPRRAAHQVADLVHEALTGTPGYFSSRIAYITAAGQGTARRFYLRVVDSDGANAVTVATSREPLMSPHWSPDRRQLAYVGFERGRSAIYVHTLANGKLRRLAHEPGINGAPAWSPDGREIAATLSFGRNPDIYVIDVASGARRQLTRHAAIDTEPSWSPDGRHIAFTSDRGGQPQVYVVGTGGGEAKRLTFEGTQNLRPRYSPDGASLALVNARGTSYRIALLDLATRQLRVLGEGPRDESPSFAPNGTVVIYAAQGQQGVELATVTVDGRIRQRLRQPGDVREPAWSP